MSTVGFRRLLVLVGLFALARSSSGQGFSPYSDFQALSLTELATLQVKFTYVGEQSGGVGTGALTAVGNVQNLSLFKPFRRSAYTYINDAFGEADSFKVTVQELKALIDSVGTVPEITAGQVDAGGILSFALLNPAGGATRAFEAVLGVPNGKKLFTKVLSALTTQDAVGGMVDMACMLGMIEPTPPTDVSAQVSVKLKGVRLDRKTGQFVARLAVTNTSAQTIESPMIVALYPSGAVRLVSPDGFTTCAVPPGGMPFKNLPVGSGLQPSQQVSIVVRFDNPDRRKIEFDTIRVLAGEGMR